MGKSSINRPFSMAMLNNQTVMIILWDLVGKQIRTQWQTNDTTNQE